MENIYESRKIRLVRAEKQTEDVKLYSFKLPKNNFKIGSEFKFIPGQFIMLSIDGVGEAPFAPVSDFKRTDTFQLSIRKKGVMTDYLDKISPPAILGLRGPFGNGFPISKMRGKDIILTAGGMGIVPFISLIEYLIKRQKQYRKIYLLFGAKTAADLIFQEKFKKWQRFLELILCVEKKTGDWRGPTGLVTDFCGEIEINPAKTIVIMCGPTIMFKFMSQELNKMKIEDCQIYVSMEAKMKCGVGKCQHCTCGKKYVCLDGPVFRWDEIKNEI